MVDSAERFDLLSASATHVGTVRSVNEDACVELPEAGVWAVADGMGGHKGGDVASRVVVEALSALAAPVELDAFLGDVQQRLEAANRRLREYAAINAPGDVVGSTVAALVAFRNQGVCVWVGDSRIYLLRGQRLVLLTRDHSQVEEMVSLGLIDRAEAEHHPAGNVITRAVGAADDILIDMVAHELEDGDIYLICSDGLSNVVSDDEMRTMLSDHGYADAAETLIRRALDNGARDNVTAVVVHAKAR